jgi:hypothetical protein
LPRLRVRILVVVLLVFSLVTLLVVSKFVVFIQIFVKIVIENEASRKEHERIGARGPGEKRVRREMKE